MPPTASFLTAPARSGSASCCCCFPVALPCSADCGRSASPSPGRYRASPSWLGFVLAMSAVTFAVGLLAPDGRTILNIAIHDAPQYLLQRVAARGRQRGGAIGGDRFRAVQGGAWLVWGLAGKHRAWAATCVCRGGALEASGGGPTTAAAGIGRRPAWDFWRSAACASLSLGLVVLYRDRFDGQGPVTGVSQPQCLRRLRPARPCADRGDPRHARLDRCPAMEIPVGKPHRRGRQFSGRRIAGSARSGVARRAVKRWSARGNFERTAVSPGRRPPSGFRR